MQDHCPQQKLKLCPYRDELPATADKFLWGSSMFNTLGRFKGLNDEMGLIVRHSLAEYPLRQAEAAIVATAQQLVHVGTGEGTNVWIGHTYGIIERYLPAQVKPMRAALSTALATSIFTAINRLHVPVALASMLAGRCHLGDRDLAAAARRSHAARGDGHTGAARQRLCLRRDIGTA